MPAACLGQDLGCFCMAIETPRLKRIGQLSGAVCESGTLCLPELPLFDIKQGLPYPDLVW